MPRNSSDTYELYVERCTDLAVGVRESPKDSDLMWFPFSQIPEPSEDVIRASVGTEIEIEIPDWLAREKGLL